MKDDFAEGWIDFQDAVDRIRMEYNLTDSDILEYCNMLKEDLQNE